MSVTNNSFFITSLTQTITIIIRTLLCSFDSSFYNLNLLTLLFPLTVQVTGMLLSITHTVVLWIIFFSWLSSLTLLVVLNNFFRRPWWARSASLWQFPTKSSRGLLPVGLSCYMVSDGTNNVMKIWFRNDWVDLLTCTVNIHKAMQSCTQAVYVLTLGLFNFSLS